MISLALGELDDVLGEMENKTEAEGSIKEGWREVEELYLSDVEVWEEDVDDECIERKEEMNENDFRFKI